MALSVLASACAWLGVQALLRSRRLSRYAPMVAHTYATEARPGERRPRASEATRLAGRTGLADIDVALRNALTIILGYSELAQEDAANLGTLALLPYLAEIRQAAAQLVRLLDSLTAGAPDASGPPDRITETAVVVPDLPHQSALPSPEQWQGYDTIQTTFTV